MVMINQFDLIGDTDIDDPLQIALVQNEILGKKAAAAAAVKKAADDAAAAAKKAADDAADAAAAAAADLELSVEETQKGVLSSAPEGGVPYQDRRGQNGRRRGPGRNFESNRNGRNFESNRNVDGFSAVPEDSAQDLQGKPSIRRYSDQPYRGGGGGGRDRGYLNRDNGEYTGRPAHRQYERRSGVNSPPAKVKGELSPLVKDVPVPHVELGTTDEQNLEENATSEGKSSNPELDNAPTSNALNKNKEGMANGRKEKEPEVKVMTLEEYQKVLEGKRRDLVAKLMLIKTTPEGKVDVIKTTQERKVDVEAFESMQQLVVKKENNEFFIKLGNDKEAGKRKEDTVVGDESVKKNTVGDDKVKKDTDRVERVKKVFRKFEFQRPAEGGRGGRGGRGGQGWRGGRDGQGERGGQGWHDGQSGRGGQGGLGVQGGFDGQGGRGGRGYLSSFSDESIKDPRLFPVLGGKEVEQHSPAQWKVEQQQQQQQHSPAQGRK